MAIRPAQNPLSRAVPFFTNVPKAEDVRVSGSFCGWRRGGIPLWNDGNGWWRTTLTLGPGTYEYRLVVDGDWADHEEAELRVKNPFGGENCVLTIT